jgi:hypothetical protein
MILVLSADLMSATVQRKKRNPNARDLRPNQCTRAVANPNFFNLTMQSQPQLILLWCYSHVADLYIIDWGKKGA